MSPTKIGDGFDNSALMQDPKYKQMETMNQGMEVSEPYLEANKQAFSKNNPMNAPWAQLHTWKDVHKSQVPGDMISPSILVADTEEMQGIAPADR